ncbi:LEAF RUST 10 DISEASE-RESISTANCE LOCUS RECEPTOR-LIKE PROTEIN KINASE-LIKE 1.4 [Salix purpurea]|uniref:LEAF RUST 10 DISEASE-RESISTANCE LOCUS RECEPTOR-LIKE PROTEIN KINASE-LIKE 1.4 n=1 Tax=Salix purpurea TaxID=77065 RepID=A0A9Q0US14_SALPP|nr:LEAF RUST 10 DISEASE-RESISTANCE LOCUS RECEPTOR-LIKE PROTEIN KINASE-LIKE 1.4 [Salix purpurea]
MSWLILLPIIALVCGSAPAFADDDERYLNCMNSFDCGNITGAGYPFSGSDRPGYCGYPGPLQHSLVSVRIYLKILNAQHHHRHLVHQQDLLKGLYDDGLLWVHQ